MKKIYFVFAALLAVACTDNVVTVIPEPVSMTVGSGSFALTKSVQINCKDSSLVRTAEIFSEDMTKVLGYGPEVVVGGSGSILLSVEDGIEPEEYELEVSGSKVAVKGGSPAGVFYGLQTVKQILDGKRIPAVKITDKPHFGHRGSLLDVARHFYTVDQVKTYIDILALHKMNVLHWHLTDDQGWRIEIKKYPELTQIGSKRKGTCIRKEWDNLDGVPYEVWTRWGVSPEVLCAGNTEVYEFLEDVLTEICELFPYEYIHIGGDECPKTSWEKCPKCQAKIKQLGLKDKKPLHIIAVL